MNNTSFRTMAMKARVYNFIRKSIYKKDLDSMSISERNAIFEQIFSMSKDAHWELIHYKEKRKAKAAIAKARVERGWVAKKKTSLKEWQEKQKQLQPH